MAERKSLTKKMRFEVFKRDSFTCQYCGRMAPDVVLEVDHINAVANGGKNEIMNLVTSCFDCNRGKGKKKLSDKKEIEIQQEQLKELSEKREQLKFMLQWKKELLNFENEQVEEIQKIFREKTYFTLTDIGKRDIKKWIADFGLIEVIECTNISIDQYYDIDKKETYEKTISYIPRIAVTRRKQKENPFIAKKNYLKAIAKNHFGYIDHVQFKKMLDFLVTEENYELFLEILKNSRRWTDFKYDINYEFDWSDWYGDKKGCRCCFLDW